MDYLTLLLFLLIIALLVRIAKLNRLIRLERAKLFDISTALQGTDIGPIPHHQFDRVARAPWWRTWHS